MKTILEMSKITLRFIQMMLQTLQLALWVGRKDESMLVQDCRAEAMLGGGGIILLSEGEIREVSSIDSAENKDHDVNCSKCTGHIFPQWLIFYKLSSGKSKLIAVEYNVIFMWMLTRSLWCHKYKLCSQEYFLKASEDFPLQCKDSHSNRAGQK